MKLILFGKLADALGRQVEVTIPPEGCTVSALRALAAEQYPHAAEIILSPSLRAGIDDAIVSEDYRLKDEQVVEFFPPLSGG